MMEILWDSVIHSSPGGPVTFISNYYNEVATLFYWAAWLHACVILLKETHHVLCIYILLSKKTKNRLHCMNDKLLHHKFKASDFHIGFFFLFLLVLFSVK